MTREDVLTLAKNCVCMTKEHDYGDVEDNFKTISDFWNIYLKAEHPELDMPFCGITPKDVAIMMALLKIARIATGVGTADSYIDLAGYAACGGELQFTN